MAVGRGGGTGGGAAGGPVGCVLVGTGAVQGAVVQVPTLESSGSDMPLAAAVMYNGGHLVDHSTINNL